MLRADTPASVRARLLPRSVATGLKGLASDSLCPIPEPQQVKGITGFILEIGSDDPPLIFEKDSCGQDHH
jgi:hypothetical protein